jgi:(1->4)-alpha-D-glucan 1-alpha-D-glucosylmutase
VEELRLAIGELIACFPTYRTYIRKSRRQVCPSDLSVISEAIHEALGRTAHLAGAIRFVGSLLTFQFKVPAEQEADVLEFVLKFQQLTSPAAAKGIEDTAFYNYHRLVSLNEVGGNPGQFGIAVQEFHRANGQRAELWPHSLNATTTHDTKRGEDARARINVLSEMPCAWRSAVVRWSEKNGRHKSVADGESAPDANDEYLFYQTLVGAWPAELFPAPGCAFSDCFQIDEQPLSKFRARIGDYMLKAIREAKRKTSWTDAHTAYEQATGDFVNRVLATSSSEFLADFIEFIRPVAFFGAINSLSQTLLKLTSPGVPDVYQGSELCDLSLVDPDNRRPVDYEERRRLLEGFKHGDVSGNRMKVEGDDLLSGKVKMILLWKALNYRRAHRDLFDRGDYTILTTRGTRSNHLCAFARAWRGEYIAVVCPRLNWILNDGAITPPCGAKMWPEEELDLADLPARGLRNVITGETLAMGTERRLPIAEVLRTFPVALLATS